MKSTKVICPCCGAEFALPENEHFTAGIAIGKDSGMGTIQLPLDKEGSATAAPEAKGNKAEARLRALRAAGVDTSDLFSLRGAAGEGLLVRTGTDGTPEIVPDDDPIFNAILRSETIPERRLFRRWIMAQIFRALAEGKDGFNKHVNNFDCRYEFKMLLDEMNAQFKMKANDPENYVMRNRWFNAELVAKTLKDYKARLEKTLKNATAHFIPDAETCLIRIEGNRQYTTEQMTSIIHDIERIIRQVSNKPGTCVGAIKEFLDIMPTGKLPTAKEWKNAYKGAGAYFTLRNLILFHGCVLHDAERKAMTKEKSLTHLDTLADRYSKQGWKLLSRLMFELETNDIDVKAKRKQWAENARLRREAKLD